VEETNLKANFDTVYSVHILTKSFNITPTNAPSSYKIIVLHYPRYFSIIYAILTELYTKIFRAY